ncbi:Creatinine amidohydrolase/Fe(II)-dependent formamide hydrolase involved in riboflavin and F420 biosynthesis [Variovorax sp. HW608]|uniref:creatininase family protein n=1 Tax=Variovorax sp. HW608 TaxID=1034889 RepID=UPI00081F773E|nr:creatininase family protein [Variovorax sp. HW608]SCK45942.1 Creatinine amidohydrolase/Fe(II)-dependent formamide hydrolase involved in riboflavin and F420 biosynthesis [Variovorax sp. HW608]
MQFPLGFRRAAFLLAMLLGAQLALAQAEPHTVLLEDLTWTELRDQVGAGKTTILIPIGGTEQSGPDMALGKHNARVLYLSRRIAEELGNAIVAPVVAYVPEGGYAPPTSHMRFPGTITVPEDAFEKTLASAANSFKAHGFRDIVFLGDHGGYQKSIQRVVAMLNKSWANSGARAFVPPAYYESSSDGFDRILRSRGYRDDEIGTHAALADTSLQLASAPQMVRLDRLRQAPKRGPSDGVYGGDPRRATAELGKLGIDAIVADTVAAIRKDTERH